ncbi:hypothetical protein V7S43_007175 [Phytophthora oleae]|uniref:Uncharacterized protein n=1 Tax=Phytophthora oleae TaxID=2107226 RepID=A0ABD3FMR1_9STRA
MGTWKSRSSFMPISRNPATKGEKDTEKRRLRELVGELSNCFELGSNPRDVVREVSGKTMMLAAVRDFLDVVKWLYTQFHADRTMNLFWVRGQVDRYSGKVELYDYTKSDLCSVVDAAAGKGHLEIVQYLLQVEGKAEDERAPKRRRTDTYPELSNRYKMPTTAGCTTAAMNVAAAHGHLDVVQWLHANCSQGCTTAAMDRAAQNGHLETVKWLHFNRKEGCTIDAMNGAAIGGHLHVIKWLHEHTSEGCTTDAMDFAAVGGHFELLKWLHENRTEGCTVAAMDGAAASGLFDIVKWLHKHRAKCRKLAMDGAAHGGHLRLLRWLFENRKEGVTSKALRNTMQFAQFETLPVLHNIVQQGLAKDIEVMDAEQSEAWIAEHYLKMAERFRTPNY